LRFRRLRPQRLAALLCLAACPAAFGEGVEVEHVLGPASFRATDGRAIHYFGLSLPTTLEDADRQELKSKLSQQHGGLLLGKAVTIVPRNHGNQADKPVQAFVFHGDKLLNIEVLRLGLAVLDASAAGKLGAHEDQFLEAQLEAGKEGRGIWREQQLRGLLVGSRRSQRVHQPFCPWSYRIGAKNRALFQDAEAARSAGMAACGVCFAGQEFPQDRAEPPGGSPTRAPWATLAIVACVLGVLALFLARTVRARLFLKALKRMRDARRTLAESAAQQAVSRRRPPVRPDCDLSALLARCHPRWRRYLAPRSILWHSEAPAAGVVAAVPEADVKRLLAAVLVHLRDRLPADAAVHSRLSTSPQGVVLAFSVSVPRAAFGGVVPPPETVVAWSGLLPKETGSIEVFREPGSDGSPHPLLTVRLPREA